LHIARRIKEHASQEGGEGAWVRTVREEGWEGENCRNMGLVGRHQVLWTRSHQEGEAEPNRFVVEGNEEADRGAGGREGSPPPPDVLLPVGGDRFFCIHEGRMVTTEIGAYIRDWARSQAEENWGSETKRPQQGAVARQAGGLHKGTLDVEKMAEHKLRSRW
jgi:hypothetical protein